MRAALSLVEALLASDGLPAGHPPAEVREVAKQCVLDWFGVTLAGAGEELAVMLRAEAEAAGGAPQAGIVGTAARTSALFAALVNGATSHALDYDDTNLVMMGHSTAPVLPAALAEAEVRAAGGLELLNSFIAGVELECRLGLALSPGHYAAGWHPTGTLGTFGAAAACCHLAGLDRAATRAALGIAATQAAGLKSAFGTMSKPLHAGKAAFNGLLAARLGARGFTASDEMIDGAQGFVETHAPEIHPERLDELGTRYLITETLFKYHAACYLTHSTIENLRRLRLEGVPADDAELVEVRVHPAALTVCDIAEPQTGLEGKFSLRATAAMGLLGDPTDDVATFSDARMADPRLRSLRDRVRVSGDEDLAAAEAVAVVHAGGRRFESRSDAGLPARDIDTQWQRLEAKFTALASPVLGESGARNLREAIRSLEHLPAADLVRLSQPA
ncbi:MAG TPA: MmgE/PrpD family protein [Candidatus Dormibacteraeota bacterium]